MGMSDLIRMLENGNRMCDKDKKEKDEEALLCFTIKACLHSLLIVSLLYIRYQFLTSHQSIIFAFSDVLYRVKENIIQRSDLCRTGALNFPLG